METLKHLFHHLTDVETLVRVGGLTAMTIIVFAETGLMIGFFLPGDSLLVTAGVFAARGNLNIWALNGLLIAAAILGDTVGYWIGRRAGTALFTRPKSLLFNPRHLKRAHDFYEKHGGKTIILARFMPIVRTFAPVVAGMAQMNYRRFVSFNVVGGVLWVVSMTLIGYFLGQFEWVRKNIEVVILIVVFASILPGIIAFAREWLKGRAKRP
ncbi:MAG: VTT domain-containing protein [Acidobacteriota bacterium]|nr:VTT domain-containing protein [Acidobacteriota bacterium]